MKRVVESGEMVEYRKENDKIIFADVWLPFVFEGAQGADELRIPTSIRYAVTVRRKGNRFAA